MIGSLFLCFGTWLIGFWWRHWFASSSSPSLALSLPGFLAVCTEVYPLHHLPLNRHDLQSVSPSSLYSSSTFSLKLLSPIHWQLGTYMMSNLMSGDVSTALDAIDHSILCETLPSLGFCNTIPSRFSFFLWPAPLIHHYLTNIYRVYTLHYIPRARI